MITNTPLSLSSGATKRKRHGGLLVGSKSGTTSRPNDVELPDDIQQELDNLPDFPHRPVPTQRTFPRPPRAITQPRSFKNQHHLALTDIFHGYLREGDFKRAERAFALLLRFEHRGDTLDLRKDNNWRLAVEILLRRGGERQGERTEDARAMGIDKLEDRPTQEDKPFSPRGFADSKELYDRLILQYPYQRSNPKAVSALTFYPALFTLCIYQIQSQYHAARSGSPGIDLDQPASPVSPRSHSPSSEDVEALESGSFGPADGAIKDADELRGRLAEVLLMPPYDNSAQLLDLHAMVCTWIADLREEHVNDESAIANLRAQAVRSRTRANESISMSNDT